MADAAIRTLEEQMQQIAQQMAQQMAVQQQMMEQLAEQQRALRDSLHRGSGDKEGPTTDAEGWKNHLKVPRPKPYDGKTSIGAVENFIFDCEQYFEARKITVSAQKILFATSMLEGMAKTWWWFQLEQVERDFRRDVSTWEDFATELKGRFQVVNAIQNARDKLANLKQVGGVRGYVAQFQNIIMQIPDVNEGECLDKFMRGLRTKTRIEVRLRRPTTLDEAIQIAECYDSLLQETTVVTNPRQLGNRQPFPQRMGGPHIPRDGAVPMEIDAIRRIPLTPAERERLSKIGGCFYCRQIGHMVNTCPNRGENRPRRVAQIERADLQDENLSENGESQ